MSKEKPSMNEGQSCSGETEVFSRVTGFYRPVQQWNKGKAEEFKERVPYKVKEDLLNEKDRTDS